MTPPHVSAELAPLFKRVTTVAGASFDEERVRKAFLLAQEIYGSQDHWTGMSLLEHTIGVLETLMPFEPDEDAIIACLLHHALYSENCTLSEIEEQFGSNVRSLVSGVHLLSHVTLQGRRHSIEDLRLMLLSVSDDVRIILMILCDRCYTLSHVCRLPAEDAKRTAQDVLQLFAPVAARLGIYAIKHTLEGYAFPVVYPSDAERIQEQLEQAHQQRGVFLDAAAEELRSALAEQGITVEVEAREKHPYSIFLKMHKKSITHIEDIYDLFALRVIVHSEDECYQALGVLHRIGRPVTHRFKDFIAFPKPNGYQSLHTTLMQLPGVPENMFVEVQVRTQDMHREAKLGIAAHWSYKENGSTMQAMQRVQLHDVLMGQQSVEEGSTVSLTDHIFVLTPQGDIVELPEGATPLDFAFQVHTDLGLSFRSAIVNGAIVSLDYQLENGDVVDIRKRRTPHPSPQWMQHLRVASSRSRLKRYLYAQDRPQLIVKGRELLNQELRKRHLPLLDTDLSLLKECDGEKLTSQKREDLLMKIGQESEKASSLLPRLDALKGQDFSKKQTRKRPPRLQRKGALIDIEGGVPMPMRFAKCCKPNEGEHGTILGVINRAGEVMIHRQQCGMIRNTNPERRIGVWWRKELRIEN